MAGPPDGGGTPCDATVASNAIALSSNYLAAGTVGKGGYEYVLLLGIVLFAIAIRGGGPYSVDRLIGKEL